MLNHLTQLWKVNKFPNSIIIAGSDTQSSKNLILNFIDSVSADEHKLRSANNLDIYQIEKDVAHKSILIEQIRHLKIWTNQSSVLGKNKFALICDAESMTFSAVNACLKILEEPSRNTYFFLTTNSPKSLPKTMLSRCWLLHNTVTTQDPLYLELTETLLNSNVEELQKLLLRKEIQKSMKNVLLCWLRSSLVKTNNLNDLEMKLLAKMKLPNLAKALKITDKVNELIQSHLELSFDTKHIATLILAELFPDD